MRIQSISVLGFFTGTVIATVSVFLAHGDDKDAEAMSVHQTLCSAFEAA